MKNIKKYLSCIVLIVLCLVCAMVFYANADEFLPSDDSTDTESQGTVTDSSLNNSLTDDELTNAEIEDCGTILSEYFASTNLRLEWTALKLKGDPLIYFSVEVYLDTPNQITTTGAGYIEIDGEKTQIAPTTLVGDSNLLATATKSVSYENGNEILLSAFLEIDISTVSGVKLSRLECSGKVLINDEYKSMPKSHKIELEHISQYPELPSGDEVTSLAMVLKYLKYEVDKCELCDLYLDKGPVGYTSFYKANVGNPRNAYNSYGCLSPVIAASANKFIKANGGNLSARDISRTSKTAMLSEIASGNPIIVWTCEDFDVSPIVSRIWVVDGESLYLKSNMTSMVLIGYNLEENTVTLANPAGNIFDIDMDTFFLRFMQCGAYAVVIK